MTSVITDTRLDLSPAILTAFDEATLALLDARALLHRVDRKYILPATLLEPLLARLTVDYRVLKAAGHVAATYDTRYFDTPARLMFEDHRRGRRPRYKVRIRHHLERRVSFLEIKRKRVAQQTSKLRMAHPFGFTVLGGEARLFINAHCPVDAATLVPSVDMTFKRITLIGQHVNERITLDCLLRYSVGTRCEALPGVVIAELKQAHFSNTSPAVRALRAFGVHERSVSKYCLATVRLCDVRANKFKAALRAVESMAL